MSSEKNAESKSENVVQENGRRHPKNIHAASAAVGVSFLGVMAFGPIVIDV